MSTKLQLLLADDSDEFRQLVIAYIKALPIEVTEVIDGHSALELMKEQAFDVVLMDYKMPIMDGATSTRLLREWEQLMGKSPQFIIALSAFSLKQDRDVFFNAGCDTFLTKPIGRADIVNVFESVLKEKNLT